ncbi:hypothetical protein B0H11DRAFT_1929851 [Mycena galericulata]|nr:hypothetical protein B0H11DRAFT_1929851 [Mycena galericulata]
MVRTMISRRSQTSYTFQSHAPAAPIVSRQPYTFLEALSHQNGLTMWREDSDQVYRGELPRLEACAGFPIQVWDHIRHRQLISDGEDELDDDASVSPPSSPVSTRQPASEDEDDFEDAQMSSPVTTPEPSTRPTTPETSPTSRQSTPLEHVSSPLTPQPPPSREHSLDLKAAMYRRIITYTAADRRLHRARLERERQLQAAAKHAKKVEAKKRAARARAKATRRSTRLQRIVGVAPGLWKVDKLIEMGHVLYEIDSE